MNKEFGRLYCDLNEDTLKISDIVVHDGKSYYVDTCYVLDGDCLETMVFEMIENVPEDYELEDDFESKVDWMGIYQGRHRDVSEAKRIHLQLINNLKEHGSVKGAMN